jgi:hypothetical protein
MTSDFCHRSDIRPRDGRGCNIKRQKVWLQIGEVNGHWQGLDSVGFMRSGGPKTRQSSAEELNVCGFLLRAADSRNVPQVIIVGVRRAALAAR